MSSVWKYCLLQVRYGLKSVKLCGGDHVQANALIPIADLQSNPCMELQYSHKMQCITRKGTSNPCLGITLFSQTKKFYHLSGDIVPSLTEYLEAIFTILAFIQFDPKQSALQSFLGLRNLFTATRTYCHFRCPRGEVNTG